MKLTGPILILITTLGFTSGKHARAGEKDMLFALPGFPGTTAQAQPFVDKVLRHLETKLTWTARSMTGIYLPDSAGVFEKIAETNPGIALLDPSVYAKEQSRRKMKVIARVEVNGRGEEKYTVIARKDGPKTLAELAGKRIEGVVVHDPQYVGNVIFGGAIPLNKLNLAHEKRPLKALRNVVRKEATAAIIDQSVREHLKDLPFAGELQVIYESESVPAPAIVVTGPAMAQAKRIAAVLVGMCSQADGRELCKTLTISSIQAAKGSDYAAFLKKYNR